MALRTRQDAVPVRTGVTTENILRTSRLLSTITGFDVQPNKAIVGRNAFAHESGIHQDGMLKNAQTYEIMTPESVGWTKTNLVMGKHSRPRSLPRQAARPRLRGTRRQCAERRLPPFQGHRRPQEDRLRRGHRGPRRRRGRARSQPPSASSSSTSMQAPRGPARADLTLEIDGATLNRNRDRRRPGGCHLQGHSRSVPSRNESCSVLHWRRYARHRRTRRKLR